MEIYESLVSDKSLQVVKEAFRQQEEEKKQTPSSGVKESEKSVSLPIHNVSGLRTLREHYLHLYHHLYSYQKEVVHKALTYDCICYLPTGAGKTFVAATLMARSLLLYPDRATVFVIHRVPLAKQQSQVLSHHLGTNVPCVTGGSNYKTAGSVQRGMAQMEHKVFCVIDTIFKRWISEDPAFLRKNVALIVFDEVHHARGGDYKCILDAVHSTPPVHSRST
ncbi:hypothetical protein AGDE_13591 [Angomonas deanei]|nr:hypothetical protein AGDE_13591 [Angomonas deanei]|eukprot:EPY22115.1 hypothetical protein AGDE_13591 [Angomonas deanei]